MIHCKMKTILIWLIQLFIISQVITHRFERKQPLIQVKYVKVKGDEEYCPLPCDSKIYCQGELLHDIQMARIYQDSKTFVDKKLLFSESEILKKYEKLKKKKKIPTTNQIKKFVAENFADETLKSWVPSDFKPVPVFTNKIVDGRFKEWIMQVNKIWLKLGAKIPDEVNKNPDRHSIIYMPEGFIKSGGRFQEMYYWDTYWIVRGLLLNGMSITVRGILSNMIYLVRQFGHMPNGNRRYYLQRSQPPLLILIISMYHHYTRDDLFLKENMDVVETEFHWWYYNRTIDIKKNGKVYKLARYNVISCSPRPESYYEDYLTSMNLTTDEEKRKFFTGIKSAAEAGWDFSSRHIRNKDGTNKKFTLLDIDTPSIIQVELNSILLANAIVLREWFSTILGDDKKAKHYENIVNDFMNAIENVLWNEEIGVWLDYDHVLGKSRNYFYVSNLTPLWAFAFYKNITDSRSRARKIVKYLKKERIINEDNSAVYYGIPASHINTGQQWDFPNCWAPLQAIAIRGLQRSGSTIAREVAFNLMKAWVRTMYEGFKACKYMYDKYSATDIGSPGGGGEYRTQIGFGWTNGFLFEIFDLWGMKLTSQDVLTETVKPGTIKCPKV